MAREPSLGVCFLGDGRIRRAQVITVQRGGEGVAVVVHAWACRLAIAIPITVKDEVVDACLELW